MEAAEDDSPAFVLRSVCLGRPLGRRLGARGRRRAEPSAGAGAAERARSGHRRRGAARGAAQPDHGRGGRARGACDGDERGHDQHRRDRDPPARRQRLPREGSGRLRGGERLRQVRGFHAGAGAGRAGVAGRAHVYAVRAAGGGRGDDVSPRPPRKRKRPVREPGRGRDERRLPEPDPATPDHRVGCPRGNPRGGGGTVRAGERGRGAGHDRLRLEGRHRLGEPPAAGGPRRLDRGRARAVESRRGPDGRWRPRGRGSGRGFVRRGAARRPLSAGGDTAPGGRPRIFGGWLHHHGRGHGCAAGAPKSGTPRAPSAPGLGPGRRQHEQRLGRLRTRLQLRPPVAALG